jgi:hypothetical protein
LSLKGFEFGTYPGVTLISLGEFFSKWNIGVRWEDSEEDQEWFDSKLPALPSLRDRIRNCNAPHASERRKLADLLPHLLAWVPAKRPSAGELHYRLFAPKLELLEIVIPEEP